MTGFALMLCFFAFVFSLVAAALVLFVARVRTAPVEPATVLAAGDGGGIGPALLGSMHVLGAIVPARPKKGRSERRRLIAAGYRDPDAPHILAGVRFALALVSALTLGWAGLLVRQDESLAVLLALSGLGLGYLLPDRILAARAAGRCLLLERALAPALDLIVLSIEAGQTLDNAIYETSRELRVLFPELSNELAQVHLELRAGRSRPAVLQDLGARTDSGELKKLSTILIDADRFGTSLAPALRTHARYLRTRRRHQAQEAARKLGVKLIFPVFFLIMPSVFVITLGPAVLQIYTQLLPMLR